MTTSSRRDAFCECPTRAWATAQWAKLTGTGQRTPHAMQAAEVYKLVSQLTSFDHQGLVTHLTEIHAAEVYKLVSRDTSLDTPRPRGRWTPMGVQYLHGLGHPTRAGRLPHKLARTR